MNLGNLGGRGDVAVGAEDCAGSGLFQFIHNQGLVTSFARLLRDFPERRAKIEKYFTIP